jgi:hypothetical protein
LNKTAVARKRPEIESYNRCALRIACAMALFRFGFTGIDWRNTAVAHKRPEIVETQNLASHAVFEFTRIGGWERGLFFALLAQLRCLRV